MEIRQILEQAVQRKASDVHLSVGRPATCRIYGRLVCLDDTPLTPKDTESFTKKPKISSQPQ